MASAALLKINAAPAAKMALKSSTLAQRTVDGRQGDGRENRTPGTQSRPFTEMVQSTSFRSIMRTLRFGAGTHADFFIRAQSQSAQRAVALGSKKRALCRGFLGVVLSDRTSRPPTDHQRPVTLHPFCDGLL